MDKKKKFLEEMGQKISKPVEKKKRFYFTVADNDIRDVADMLFNQLGCRLSTATAQETYHCIEVLYHFSCDESGDYFCPRVEIQDKEHPEMNSITPVIKGAEWIEREMSDFWGITFIDHPRPEPLLIKNHPHERRNQFRFRRIDGNQSQ